MGRSLTTRSMQIRELDLPDVFLISSQRYDDSRGTFVESYREDVLTELLGRPFRVAQTNHSVSHAGVVRGVHSALVPPGQAKIVSCLRGAILDVSVDLRIGSPTFGRHVSVPLRATEPNAVYLGEGIGHAFLALEEDTLVQYQCSTAYRPADVIAVHPLDEALGLPFTGRPDLILSTADIEAPTLAELVASGGLPRYADCLGLAVTA